MKTLSRLHESGWLNDIVINVYSSLLNSSVAQMVIMSTHFFCCDSYSVSKQEDPRKKHLRGNAANMQMVLIPVHKDAHWTLIVADRRTFTFYFLDSYNLIKEEERQSYCLSAKHYLEENASSFMGNSTWTLSLLPKCPQQTNSYDCGVYICYYMFALGKALCVGHVDSVEEILDSYSKTYLEAPTHFRRSIEMAFITGKAL